MTTKEDFSTDEWQLLLSVPPAVGTAVMHAGKSGMGTWKESWAMVSGMMRTDHKFAGNQLIESLIEARVKNHEKSDIETLHSPYVGQQPDAILQDAVQRCRKVLLVLARVPHEEMAGYLEWCMQVATKVAEAAKEGGFLGIGGERVSAEEKVALAQIREALGLRDV